MEYTYTLPEGTLTISVDTGIMEMRRDGFRKVPCFIPVLSIGGELRYRAVLHTIRKAWYRYNNGSFFFSATERGHEGARILKKDGNPLSRDTAAYDQMIGMVATTLARMNQENPTWVKESRSRYLDQKIAEDRNRCRQLREEILKLENSISDMTEEKNNLLWE